MTCFNTLIVIGRGREKIRKHFPDTDIKDHHAKLVINFSSDTPPLPYIRGMVEVYADLRFVFYHETDTFRGEIEGRRGKVTKEFYREKEDRRP